MSTRIYYFQFLGKLRSIFHTVAKTKFYDNFFPNRMKLCGFIAIEISNEFLLFHSAPAVLVHRT